MIIRKLFKFEGSHIVRNCSSDHCKQNIHGHSYQVEVFIHSDKLDHGYMAVDFILLDKMKWFIESFDHSYSLWNKEDDAFKSFIYQYNRRIAEIPVSPSAEGYALLFFMVCDAILKNTRFSNGEGNVKLSSVRVHETLTGYAEVFQEDVHLIDFSLDDILFSEGIVIEWKNTDWFNQLKRKEAFVNKSVNLEIKLP